MTQSNSALPQPGHLLDRERRLRGAVAGMAITLVLAITGCEVPEGMDRPGQVPQPARAASPTVPAESAGLAGATGTAAPSMASPSTPTVLTPAPVSSDPTPPALTDGLVASLDPVSLRYDPAIVASVRAETIEPRTPRGEPGEPAPRHIRFTLDGFAVRSRRHAPVIEVYGVDASEVVSPEAGRRIAALRELLAGRPAAIPGAADAANPLPFLPYGPAAELFHARAAVLEFVSGTGVRYLAQHELGVEPVTNADVFYTFQGLTSDGAYYVSVVLPLAAAGLPEDAGAAGTAIETAERDHDAYLAGVIADLEALDGADFTPSIDRLDAMVRSISIVPE